MKPIKILAMAIVCSALLLTTAQAAPAPPLPLNNTWFQVDIAVKGELVDPATSSATQTTFKRTAYLYVGDDGGDYAMVLFSENAPGVWSSTGGGTTPGEYITGEGVFMPVQFWQIASPDPTAVVLYVHGKFTLTVNKDDSLKKAKLSILGATIVPATFNMDGDILFGKIKIKTKMIDEGDLPAGVPLP